MSTHPINSELDIVAARMEGRALAREMGFGLIDQARIATAISELARNVAMYACHGEIRLERIEPDGQVGLQIVCVDQGPGIVDLDKLLSASRDLQDGTPGETHVVTGLRGTQHLMDEFEIDSQVGVGTTVRTCKWLPTRVPRPRVLGTASARVPEYPGREYSARVPEYPGREYSARVPEYPGREYSARVPEYPSGVEW